MLNYWHLQALRMSKHYYDKDIAFSSQLSNFHASQRTEYAHYISFSAYADWVYPSHALFEINEKI